MAMAFDRPELPDLIGFLQRGRVDMMDEPESVLPTAQVRCLCRCNFVSCEERGGGKFDLLQNIKNQLQRTALCGHCV